VEEWCRGPMATLTKDACRDKRTSIVIGDIARIIADAPRGRYDAIILDLYEGPNAQTQDHRDPFYGRQALARSYDALATDGILSIWAEEYDAPFKKRFGAAGYKVWVEKLGSSRTHTVYIGTKLPPLVEGRGAKPAQGRGGGRR
jgi:spermidine synthase